MLSGKVIKGINAGNVAFHHRTMQIIARQQTICWQWPFFLSLRDTGLSTLANAVVQEQRVHGGKQLTGFRFGLCLCAGLMQTLDVDECPSGLGGLQDPSQASIPQKAPGGAALPETRGSGPTVSFTSTALIQKQEWRKVLPPKPALPSPAGVTARSPLWVPAAPQLFPAHPGGRNTPGLEQDFPSSIASSRPGQGRSLSHTSSTFPCAWSHTQPHQPPWTFLGPF